MGYGVRCFQGVCCVHLPKSPSSPGIDGRLLHRMEIEVRWERPYQQVADRLGVVGGYKSIYCPSGLARWVDWRAGGRDGGKVAVRGGGNACVDRGGRARAMVVEGGGDPMSTRVMETCAIGCRWSSPVASLCRENILDSIPTSTSRICQSGSDCMCAGAMHSAAHQRMPPLVPNRSDRPRTSESHPVTHALRIWSCRILLIPPQVPTSVILTFRRSPFAILTGAVMPPWLPSHDKVCSSSFRRNVAFLGLPEREYLMTSHPCREEKKGCCGGLVKGARRTVAGMAWWRRWFDVAADHSPCFSNRIPATAVGEREGLLDPARSGGSM